MPLWLDHAFLRAADAVYGLGRHAPTAGQLAAVRIISHRGQHDNRTVFENTCAAFDPLRGSGIFGIECDVRWTRDCVPVVFHDAGLERLFGARQRLAELGWVQLHAGWPMVPRLEDFVRRYAGEFHLLVELKHERYPDPALQDRRLAEALKFGLGPVLGPPAGERITGLDQQGTIRSAIRAAVQRSAARAAA